MGKLKALDPILHGVIEKTYEDGKLSVERISSFISNKTQPPYSIAIEGPWGEGKTTLLKLLEDDLKSRKHPTLWFNPWEYEGHENVIVALQQHLAMSFIDKFKLTKKDVGVFALSLLAGGIDAVAQILTGKIISYKNIKEIVKDVDELFDENPGDQFVDMVKSMKHNFVKITNAICSKEEYDNKPLVIFLDDLDRCLPENSVALLEALKNFYVVKDANVIVVTGVDIGVASGFIRQKYKGMGTEQAIQYFRKIFNLTIKVPQKNTAKIREHVRLYIEELHMVSPGGGHEDGYDNADLVSTTITRLMEETKTRSVRQILNVVNNLYVIEQLKKEDVSLNHEHLLALLFMKEVWHEQYHDMIMEMKKLEKTVTFDDNLSSGARAKKYSKGNPELEQYIMKHIKTKLELQVLWDAGLL